jgi:glycosyltransferase involved in cell wall biosynthesis
MQILFLNEYASPHIVSGAERSMMALSKALSKKAKIYTLSPDLSFRSSTSSDKFPFLRKIKPGQTLSPFWFNNLIFWLYAAYHISKTVKKYHINLIHVHGKYIQPAAIISSWFTKIPVITTVRDFKFLCPLALCYTHQQKTCSWSFYLKEEISFYLKNYTNHSLIKPWLYLHLIFAKLWQSVLKHFLNQSKTVIAVSPQLKNIYQQAGIKNTISIYNLPPKGFKKQSPKYRLKNKKILISVGKLSYGKGTDSLLKAMELLEKTNPEIFLYLAGSKNISLKQNFPQNTKYLGVLDHQKVQNLYQSADAFIILSRWPEPLSRAALEALTVGLPIIASNRGGNQEVVKDNGYLVNPNDPKLVAEAIKKIFKNLNFSKNSQKLLQTRFNRRQIILKHLDLYSSL